MQAVCLIDLDTGPIKNEERVGGEGKRRKRQRRVGREKQKEEERKRKPIKS